MTTDEKNIFTEDDFDGDIDFEELEEEFSEEESEPSEAEVGFSDEEEEQTDALEDSAFSPEYDEEAEMEDEAEADDTDEPDSGEDEENDTVAMVFRNSERVQHNKAVNYSDLPVKEAQIEIPLREVYKAPPEHNQGQENRGHSSGNNIKINKFCIVNTIISAFTLCAVAAGIFAGYGYLKNLENDISLKDERIRELEKTNDELLGDYVEASAVKETETTEEEREIDIEKGKILLWDSILGYTWTPVLAGLPLNNYVQENFSLNNRNHMSYTVNGDTCSYFGIDVSSYQGDIDWQLVREDGVEFAFLRLGFRGYGEEGNIRLDDKFEANYEGAHNAGIDVGVYFYSQAISVEEAIEEAHFVLDKLNGRTLEYPIVFDWETIFTGSEEDIPRTEEVMPHTLTLSAIAFCETIQDAGYEAMIYTNKRQAVLKYDMRQLANYPVWLAQYNTTLSYIYDFDIWQYGVGTVDGIEGDVDFNIAIIK